MSEISLHPGVGEGLSENRTTSPSGIMTTDQNIALDLSSDAFLREPHTSYRLGRQHFPVYAVPDQDLVMVFGYDEVLEALMKPKIFSSKNEESVLGASIHNPECQAIYKTGWPQVPTLLTNDPLTYPLQKIGQPSLYTRPRRWDAGSYGSHGRCAH